MHIQPHGNSPVHIHTLILSNCQHALYMTSIVNKCPPQGGGGATPEPSPELRKGSHPLEPLPCPSRRRRSLPSADTDPDQSEQPGNRERVETERKGKSGREREML